MRLAFLTETSGTSRLASAPLKGGGGGVLFAIWKLLRIPQSLIIQIIQARRCYFDGLKVYGVEWI